MKQFTLLVFAALIGGMFALGGYQLFIASDSDNSFVKAENYGQLTNVKLNTRSGSTPTDFIRAAEKGMPAVVHITARQNGPANPTGNNGNYMEDFFREFSDPFNYSQPPRQGTGSGVVISPDGYIVTNNHVVEFADEYEVTLYDKRKFKATLVGTDPNTDIAVLKINSNELASLKFGNSDKAKVGEWVLAVGNPFDLTSTVTAGIISAKGRNIDILGGGAAIESFIQTDAVVNPGNSGGALINLEGDLIGINTAIKTRTGTFAGYSFAVPAGIAKKVVQDLIQYGSSKRGYLGINITDLDSDMANELGLNITEGVYIENLAENGAAIKAGLLPGDVITEVNSSVVRSAPELQEKIGQLRPGDDVVIQINRKGKIKEINVRLTELN